MNAVTTIGLTAALLAPAISNAIPLESVSVGGVYCHDGLVDNNRARVTRVAGYQVEIIFLEGERVDEVHRISASELLWPDECVPDDIDEAIDVFPLIYQGLEALFGPAGSDSGGLLGGSSDVAPGVMLPPFEPRPIPGDPPPSLPPAPAPLPAPASAPATSVSHPVDASPPANAVFSPHDLTIVPASGLIRIQYSIPIALASVDHVHYLEDTHRVLLHFSNESGLGVRDLGVGIAPELWAAWRTTPEIEFLRYEGGNVVEHRHARLVQGPPQGP
jgi:hypothetical protein